MATKAQEVQVLRDGIQANAPTPGSFALNMLFSNNCWLDKVLNGSKACSSYISIKSMILVFCWGVTDSFFCLNHVRHFAIFL